MTEETTYGRQFIDHLRALSRQSQFNYSDLQAIKAMDQQQLAAKLSVECRKPGDIILTNSAEDAAKLVYEKQVEAAVSNASTTTKIGGGLELLHTIVSLWSFAR